MAWIGLDLDQTLVNQNIDPQTGQAGEDTPTEGAIEAVNQLATEGHRLTIFTARFAPMPNSERQRLKQQIEQELTSMGFPPMEVWAGRDKPSFDAYIGNEAITYDNDWALALAQLRFSLQDRGITQQDALLNRSQTGD